MKRFLILDCYVDEPACLGVPPFISPYPRYIYGALLSAGIDPVKIDYLTIDYMRENRYMFHENYETVFLIGGAVVPGKYLGAKIGTLAEVQRIVEYNPDTRIAVGGLIHRAIDSTPRNVYPVRCDIEKFAYTMARGTPEDSFRSPEEISHWSREGSGVVKLHPWFPDIICEIESGRGCPRSSHCSFCSEGLFGKIEFRAVSDILGEVDTLISHGVTRFRIGRQADIIQFGSSLSEFRNGFPKPEPASVIELFSELGKRRKNGTIETLNVDNANPGSIVNWPDESSLILEDISSAVSPGDTLPFGIESFDPVVVKLNNLKVSPDEAYQAIRMVNEICGGREKGIPKLLPGINLIHGLRGESQDTFKINLNALEKIASDGLLVKRINIRKFQPYPGTPLFDEQVKPGKRTVNRYEYYKEMIRNRIDNHMLRHIYPVGTQLSGIYMLDCRDGYSYGKQIASYSITVKIPGEYGMKTFRDVIVTGQRERSLAALAVPVNLNKISARGLESIPGISRDKASTLILKRPFDSFDSFREEAGNVKTELLDLIEANSEL